MSIEIHILDGAIGANVGGAAESEAGTVGAAVVFDGVVRGLENGREVRGLEYEAYEPMASRQLADLAAELMTKYGLMHLGCWHSRGFVAVGESSMRVVIRSAHRAPALAAMGEFIDRLKQDVPVWKKPAWKAD